jgi:hypothetical protein
MRVLEQARCLRAWKWQQPAQCEWDKSSATLMGSDCSDQAADESASESHAASIAEKYWKIVYFLSRHQTYDASIVRNGKIQSLSFFTIVWDKLDT